MTSSVEPRLLTCIIVKAIVIPMAATPNSDHFGFCDEPLSDSSGWETVSFTETTGRESSSSLSQLSSPEFRFSSSEREFSPAVNNRHNYMDEERLQLALTSYFAKLESYEKGTGVDKKPMAAPIAREYNVNERILQKHIKDPTIQLRRQQHTAMQKLTEQEEASLVSRLLFLDSWNAPADRDQVMVLGEALLHQREPELHLGETWYYNFRHRDKNEIQFVYCKQKDKRRANAENWEIMNDFYIKVKLTIL